MTTTPVKPIPDGMHSLTPHLVCAGAAQAIDFYKAAFGAVQEGERLLTPAGKVMHAELRIGNSKLMLFDEMPEWGALSPLSLKGTPVTIHLQVENADAVFAQAIAAGAVVTMPIDDAFWGDRYGQLKDPFGHNWSVATHVRDVTHEEMIHAMAQMPAPV
jgi:PhnB protein